MATTTTTMKPATAPSLLSTMMVALALLSTPQCSSCFSLMSRPSTRRTLPALSAAATSERTATYLKLRESLPAHREDRTRTLEQLLHGPVLTATWPVFQTAQQNVGQRRWHRWSKFIKYIAEARKNKAEQRLRLHTKILRHLAAFIVQAFSNMITLVDDSPTEGVVVVDTALSEAEIEAEAMMTSNATTTSHVQETTTEGVFSEQDYLKYAMEVARDAAATTENQPLPGFPTVHDNLFDAIKITSSPSSSLSAEKIGSSKMMRSGKRERLNTATNDVFSAPKEMEEIDSLKLRADRKRKGNTAAGSVFSVAEEKEDIGSLKMYKRGKRNTSADDVFSATEDKENINSMKQYPDKRLKTENAFSATEEDDNINSLKMFPKKRR